MHANAPSSGSSQPSAPSSTAKQQSVDLEEMSQHLLRLIVLALPEKADELIKILDEGRVTGVLRNFCPNPATGRPVICEITDPSILDFESGVDFEAFFPDCWENKSCKNNFFFQINSPHLLRVIRHCIYERWRLAHPSVGDEPVKPVDFEQLEEICRYSELWAKFQQHRHQLSLCARVLASMQSHMPDEKYKTVIMDAALALSGMLLHPAQRPLAPGELRLNRFPGTTGVNTSLNQVLQLSYHETFNVPRSTRKRATSPQRKRENHLSSVNLRSKKRARQDDSIQVTNLQSSSELLVGDASGRSMVSLTSEQTASNVADLTKFTHVFQHQGSVDGLSPDPRGAFVSTGAFQPCGRAFPPTDTPPDGASDNPNAPYDQHPVSGGDGYSVVSSTAEGEFELFSDVDDDVLEVLLDPDTAAYPSNYQTGNRSSQSSPTP